MARILGIDIGAGELRVAEGERLFGPPRLTALRRVPIPDADTLASALARLALHPHATVLTTLPADRATHRLLALPFRDQRRLAQTVPLEILGQLPLEPEDATVAFAPLVSSEAGTTVFAAAARRAEVAAQVAPLAAAGLAPARVDLAPLPAWNLVPAAAGDVTLLVADGARSALTIRRHGRLAGLRALDTPAADVATLAAEVRWILSALDAAQLPIVLAGADGDAPLAAALRAGGAARVQPLAEIAVLPPGLSADDLGACAVAAGLVAAGRDAAALAFDGGGRAAPVPLRRAGALVAAAIALALLDGGLVRYGLARRDAALVAAIRAEAGAALPDARLVAPRAELEAAVTAATRGGGGDAEALAVLRELSARVPATARPDLDELAVDAGGVTLHGRLASFDAVDALRRALAASPLLADVATEETRTTVDGRGVEFRLRARRRAGETTS
jgi:hypothetical protein